MNIEGIEDFIALAECRSFSKAASLRFVTQPAFSRRIKMLEDNLGVSLADRSVTPVALTKAGERFLVYARNMVEIMDLAVEEVQSQTTALYNPVRMVMPLSVSVTFFPAWYRDMQRKISGLHVSLSSKSSSRCLQDIRKGVADIGIIVMADGVSCSYDLNGLQSCVIGKDVFSAVRARHAEKTCHDLLAYRNGSFMDSCTQDILRRNKSVNKFKVVFESQSSELLRSMAIAGLGVAVLQESLIEDDIRDGFLVPAFKKGEKLPCKIVLVRAPHKLSTKAENIWQIASAQKKALAS